MRITRRALLLQGAALPLLRADHRHRYCICNETFAGKNFGEACELAGAAGYKGIEIAPATLKIAPAAARRAMRDAGLQYAGLHSLVSAPPGLHLTTPDAAVRGKSWDFFRTLVDLSGELSAGAPSVMVLGSGKQRGAVDGSSVDDARRRLREGLAAMAAHAEARRVQLLLEPLSPEFTNVVNTLGEAVEIVREIGSPAVSSMFDTHNTVAETEPHDQLIRKHRKYIRHVHLNELDGRHPGTGKYDFALVLKALENIGFTGWVSLEVFRFDPSGEEIAKETMAYLRKVEGKRQ